MSFASPASSELGPKPADLNGHLLIITPNEYKTGIVTSLGEAEAIQCDVVDLDTSEEHFDVLFFNVALRSALKPNIGKQVLARIGQGIAKPGKSAPWILNDATQSADDIKCATDYLSAKATGAFTSAPAVEAKTGSADALKSVVDVNDPAIAALLASLTQ
jgi:hypothetical protein